MTTRKPLLLVIFDGFGVSLEKEGNPVTDANTPNLKKIQKFFPFTTLQASGTAVGLPWGEAGNSEVGHLTIGSGRVIYHHLPRIIYSIYDGSFFSNKHFISAIEHIKKNNSALHLAGLVSSGSVHSYIDHLYALLELTTREKVTNVWLHIFMDGKDAPPAEGLKFIEMLEERIQKEWPQVKIASIIGRFYAMDRDEKWDRVQKAYELLTDGKGENISSATDYIKTNYDNGIMDEFMPPAQVDRKGIVKDDDALIFFNFREDSMREISHSFVDDVFDYFPRKKIQNMFLVTMTEYQKDLSEYAAFPALDVKWPLSRVLGEAGMRHLHIAETQKYAHVTYFFNGGLEKPFPGEERLMIPSGSARFDEDPQMKAEEIADKILENFLKFDVIIANFANADMVGHTGNYQAAIKAVETLDKVLGILVDKVLETANAAMILTADHGNVELKRNIYTGEKLTEHSINPVPFFLIGEEFHRQNARTDKEINENLKDVGGILTDVAPTVIDLLNLRKPHDMTGESLLYILIEK